jgi:ankyrin repeat protein
MSEVYRTTFPSDTKAHENLYIEFVALLFNFIRQPLLAAVDSGPRLEDQDQLSALMIACHCDDLEAVRALISASADATQTALLVKRVSPKLKITALHLAAFHGTVDIVDLLLRHGADPLSPNSEGDTPLLLAAHTGSSAVFFQLLSAIVASQSVAVHVTMPAAQAAAEAIAPTPDPRDSPALAQHASICSAIAASASACDAAWRALCMASNEGMHCLLYAAEAAHADLVDSILELAQRVDNHRSGSSGSTPNSSVQSLVNLCNISASSALHFAISAGATQIVDALLGAGADVNARTEDGFSALLLAVQEGNATIVAALLAGGADPNARDTWSQNTPLHIAIEAGRVDLVSLLLANGGTTVAGVSRPPVDSTVTNLAGLTALMLARSIQNDEVVALLERHACAMFHDGR